MIARKLAIKHRTRKNQFVWKQNTASKKVFKQGKEYTTVQRRNKIVHKTAEKFNYIR